HFHVIVPAFARSADARQGPASGNPGCTCRSPRNAGRAADWPGLELELMTEPLIDLRALLVEREDFEGGMVGKLREGLAQGGPQIRNLKEISEILQKRLAVAAGPQQKKIHLKLGVVDFYLGHIRTAVEHLTKAEGPLAAFFLGHAHVYLGQSRAYAENDGDSTDHLDAAYKAFDKAEKSGY